MIRNITERKDIETDRLKAISSLKRSNQELDDFAYIASHDLKEPLRGLYNNATFLKEDYASQFDEAGIKRLDRIGYLCERMEKLIDDLLYFSRLGRQDLAYHQTNLNEVVHDISSMMESSSEEHRVSIRIPEPLPHVVCDSTRIQEVFRNLITNAIKYNLQPEKLVEIGCLQQPDDKGSVAGNVFYVRDNGIGIPRESQDDVFTIFKRLNPEDDTVRGSGVGLTFAKKIIERHGGKIWLDSEVGKGTTFYFTFEERAQSELAAERQVHTGALSVDAAASGHCTFNKPSPSKLAATGQFPTVPLPADAPHNGGHCTFKEPAKSELTPAARVPAVPLPVGVTRSGLCPFKETIAP